MKYNKSEVFSSFLGAAMYIATNVREGWELDKDNPPELTVFNYYVSLSRDDEPVVKMTRAEILTKARAARGTKQAGGKE